MTTATITVTAREERAERAAIHRAGGIIVRSTVLNEVEREQEGVKVSLGNGYRITYLAR